MNPPVCPHCSVAAVNPKGQKMDKDGVLVDRYCCNCEKTEDLRPHIDENKEAYLED